MLYTYLMVKDGNSVNIDLISTVLTTEENGVEVSIPYKREERGNISNGLQYLVFFPNIFIKGEDTYSHINDYKIKYFNTFATCCFGLEDNILLGNVLYPFNSSLFDSDIISWYRILKSSNSALKFDIGELEITPNRESIIYSSKTIDIIKKRFKEYKEEVISLYKSKYQKDYNNITDFLKDVCYDQLKYKLIEEKGVYNTSIEVDISKLMRDEKDFIKYKGEDITSIVKHISNCWRGISNYIKPNLIACLYQGTYIRDTNRLRNKTCNTLKEFDNIIIPENTKINYYIREYLTALVKSKLHVDSYYMAISICNKLDKEVLKKTILEEALQRVSDSSLAGKICNILTDSIYDSFNSHSIIFDPNNKDFLDFKEELKEENKINTSIVSNTIISIEYMKGNSDTYYVTTKEFKNSIEYINWANGELIGGTIITNKKNPYREAYSELSEFLGYNIIYVNMPILKFNNQIKSYISDDKLFSYPKGRIKILNTIFTENINLTKMPLAFSDLIPSEDLKKIEYLNTFKKYEYYSKLESLLKDKIINYEKDDYIIHCSKINTYYREKWETLSEILNKLNLHIERHREIITHIIMKSKLFRISYVSYKLYKNSTLFKFISHDNLQIK